MKAIYRRIRVWKLINTCLFMAPAYVGPFNKAVDELIQIGDHRIIKMLINKGLRHSNSTVRLQAAKALGRIGDEESVGALITTLRDEVFSVRVEAAGALAMIGDLRAFEFIVQAIRDEEERDDVVFRSYTTGEVSTGDRHKSAKQMRVMASYGEALSFFGKSAEEWLNAAEKDKSIYVNNAAVYALSKIQESGIAK